MTTNVKIGDLKVIGSGSFITHRLNMNIITLNYMDDKIVLELIFKEEASAKSAEVKFEVSADNSRMIINCMNFTQSLDAALFEPVEIAKIKNNPIYLQFNITCIGDPVKNIRQVSYNFYVRDTE